MNTCKSQLATRPILYSDTISGEQVSRDDMWAVTTEELNGLQAVMDAVDRLLHDRFFMSQYEDSNFVHYAKAYKEIPNDHKFPAELEKCGTLVENYEHKEVYQNTHGYCGKKAVKAAKEVK